jgi:hypothetical protein
VVGERSSRFGLFSAAAASGALCVAATGCAGVAPIGLGQAQDARLEAQAIRLLHDLDRTPAFDPGRRAAEPALVALAAKIAATLGAGDPAYGFASFDLADVQAAELSPLSAPPAVIAAPATIWAVEFGQFDDNALAQALWVEISAAAPDAARGLSPRVASGRDGVSLRAGPVEDREKAAALCAAFAAAGVGCTPARFVGAPLTGAGG